jgi:uncharacterized Zn finger protein (UPF0148 family)
MNNITKEGFINACKEGTLHQRLVGDNMSTIDIDGALYCPFCGSKMQTKKGKLSNQWTQICDCELAVKTNKELNEQIKIIEDAQDAVQDIFKTINEYALKQYKKAYLDVVLPELTHQFEKDKLEILNITSLD